MLEDDVRQLMSLALEGIQRIGRIEQRLERIEGRLDKVESRLDRIEIRLDSHDSRFDQLERRMHEEHAETREYIDLVARQWGPH